MEYPHDQHAHFFFKNAMERHQMWGGYHTGVCQFRQRFLPSIEASGTFPSVNPGFSLVKAGGLVLFIFLKRKWVVSNALESWVKEVSVPQLGFSTWLCISSLCDLEPHPIATSVKWNPWRGLRRVRDSGDARGWLWVCSPPCSQAITSSCQ